MAFLDNLMKTLGLGGAKEETGGSLEPAETKTEMGNETEAENTSTPEMEDVADNLEEAVSTE